MISLLYKTKIMNKNIYFLLLFLIAVTSCGKEESLTKTDLLTQSPWILTSSNYSPPYPTDGGSIVNRYALIPDCYRDDLFYYNPSGTYTNTEGASKCSPSDPDVWELGVWTFNEDESRIYKGIIDYIFEYDIIKLDGNELQLQMLISDSLSNLYTLTDVYKHP